MGAGTDDGPPDIAAVSVVVRIDDVEVEDAVVGAVGRGDGGRSHFDAAVGALDLGYHVTSGGVRPSLRAVVSMAQLAVLWLSQDSRSVEVDTCSAWCLIICLWYNDVIFCSSDVLLEIHRTTGQQGQRVKNARPQRSE